MSVSRYIPESIRKLEPYAPEGAGLPVRLDANESFIDLPEQLRREVAAAVAATSFNRYPDPRALELCRAYAGYIGLPVGRVAAGNGSDELIGLLISAFTREGDAVMTLAPDFSMYAFYAESGGRRAVRVQKNADLAITPEEVLEAARREKPALLIFSNPCNPTGQGLKREEVETIVRGCGCLCAVDEAYMEFWDQSVAGLTGELDNLIVLRTCSKSLGLAALRVGFALSRPDLCEAILKVKAPYNVNALSQAAARAVLAHGDYLEYCRRSIIASRESLFAKLLPLSGERLRLLPGVTNFAAAITPVADGLHSALEGEGISVRRLGGGLLRLTCGSAEENDRLAAALKRALVAVRQ